LRAQRKFRFSKRPADHLEFCAHICPLGLRLGLEARCEGVILTPRGNCRHLCGQWLSMAIRMDRATIQTDGNRNYRASRRAEGSPATRR
jgi:hypothetical protein